MSRYLDPKNDLTFKRIFGEHKNLCMSLLNNLLPLGDDEKIVSLEYHSGELIPELEIAKHSIVDVRCTDALGRQFIVEMQMYWTSSFKFRTVFNAAKTYVKQLGKTDKYVHLKPVYSLALVNDVFEPDSSDYYHEYGILNKKDSGKRLEGLEFVFIELPKFKPDNRAEKKLYDLWLRFLTEVSEATDDLPPEFLATEEIREAIEYVVERAYTQAEMFTYDDFRDAQLIEDCLITDAREKGLTQGREEGITKGREEGIVKGREEGIVKGREEGIVKGREEGIVKGREEGIVKGREEGIEQGKIEIAKNLQSSGMTDAEISRVTGLTLAQIEKLKVES